MVIIKGVTKVPGSVMQPQPAAPNAPSTTAAPPLSNSGGIVLPPPAVVVPSPQIITPTVIEQPGVPERAITAVRPSALPMARPADLPTYIDLAPGEEVGAGLENSGDEGLRLPLLHLAQPLTPQVVEHKMQGGDMFTSDAPDQALMQFGQQANFIPFFHHKEWIEWAPRETGRGMISRSKDPRGELARRWASDFGRTKDANLPADQQTMLLEYHVFFVMFEGSNEPVAIPMAKTKHRKGRLLISLALRRGSKVPLYAGKYSISAVLEKNKKGQSYFNYDFKPAGWATEDEFRNAALAYATVKAQYDKLQLAFNEDEQVPVEEVSPGEGGGKDY